MAIRTADEYRQSLRDGRSVYIFGEKVEDVTTHPILKIGTDTAAGDFVLTESTDQAVRDSSSPSIPRPASR
jgi:aromatic ring hydroxylase